jgi:hypothetical protein
MKMLEELFPGSNLIPGLIVLCALALLGVVTVIQAIHEFIVIPRSKSQLFGLNSERAELAQQALASAAAPQWSAPQYPPPPPFVGWVELVALDGSIKIAGQVFPHGTAFEAVARDENHLPRASVVTDGRADVFILSHGEKYRARFENSEWNIEQILQ